MSVQSSSVTCSVSSSQVWARLGTGLQKRVIRLMAQLAFNLVATQSGWLIVEDKVSNHVIPPHHPQDPA
jgi:hypothetical protein